MCPTPEDFRDKLASAINDAGFAYGLRKSPYGHYVTTPMPSPLVLSEFYERRYYGEREAVASKGMDTGSNETFDRYHFDRQYEEIAVFLEKRFGVRDVPILDVGCGMGGLLSYLAGRGFINLHGIDYSAESTDVDADIVQGSFLDFHTRKQFGLIIMNNVLEHVIDPVAMLEKSASLLTKGGVLRVQVPNDLSISQYNIWMASKDTCKNQEFKFFCPPEHLHYFGFVSLERMLTKHGFEVLSRTTSWCMDIFPLMNIDQYMSSPNLGRSCHEMRTRFEYAMGEDFLSRFYAKMAELEFGRTATLYAAVKHGQRP